MSFNDRNKTLVQLLGKVEAKHRPRYAGALAKLAGVLPPKTEKEARAILDDKGPLGPRRVAHHAMRGELVAAAQEVIRLGINSPGPQANLTWPHARSAEAEVRAALEGVRLELEREAAPPPAKAPAPKPTPSPTTSGAPAGDPPKA